MFRIKTFYNKPSENSEAQDTVPEGQTEQQVSSTDNKDGSVLTQEQVNKIVANRVKKVKEQFSDYDQLKETVTDLTTKLQQALEAIKELSQSQQTNLLEREYMNVAKELNIPVDLAKRLADKRDLVFENGKPTNLKKVLEETINVYPYLVKSQATTPNIPNTEKGTEVFSLTPPVSKLAFWNNLGGVRTNIINGE